MRKKIVNQYAVYKDEEFIAVGTAEDLSIMLGLKENTIRVMANKANKNQSTKSKYQAYLIEEDED